MFSRPRRDNRERRQMLGSRTFELILGVYFAQNDDARAVVEASKIDYGLGLPKTG